MIMKLDFNTIYPTGTCFDDAANYKVLNPEGDYYSLVHGICLNQNGESYAYAWLESRAENQIMSFGIGMIEGKPYEVRFNASIKDFHKQFQVLESKKYNLAEVIIKMMDFGTNGPWEDRFIKLCKKE